MHIRTDQFIFKAAIPILGFSQYIIPVAEIWPAKNKNVGRINSANLKFWQYLFFFFCLSCNRLPFPLSILETIRNEDVCFKNKESKQRNTLTLLFLYNKESPSACQKKHENIAVLEFNRPTGSPQIMPIMEPANYSHKSSWS